MDRKLEADDGGWKMMSVVTQYQPDVTFSIPHQEAEIFIRCRENIYKIVSRYRSCFLSHKDIKQIGLSCIFKDLPLYFGTSQECTLAYWRYSQGSEHGIDKDFLFWSPEDSRMTGKLAYVLQYSKYR